VKVLITAQAVAAVVTVVALFPAVARFGIAGAAGVSSAAYTVAFGVMLAEFLRASDRPAADVAAAVDGPPRVVDE
jgi:O-antigen/teichoic acid export membrane protein